MQKRSFSSLLQLPSYSSIPVTVLPSCLQCCNHVFQLLLPCSDLLWIELFYLLSKVNLTFVALGCCCSLKCCESVACVHEFNKLRQRRCQNAKMKCKRSLGSLRTVHLLLAFVYRARNPMKVCRICWTKLAETPSRRCTSADPAAISGASAVRQLFLHGFKGHEIWF